MDEMPLKQFLTTVKPGDEWGWETEIELLRRNHSERIDALVLDIFSRGIQEPILIGTDSRCWDGHHRVTAAYILGLPSIPIIYAQKEAT